MIKYKDLSMQGQMEYVSLLKRERDKALELAEHCELSGQKGIGKTHRLRANAISHELESIEEVM